MVFGYMWSLVIDGLWVHVLFGYKYKWYFVTCSLWFGRVWLQVVLVTGGLWIQMVFGINCLVTGGLRLKVVFGYRWSLGKGVYGNRWS